VINPQLNDRVAIVTGGNTGIGAAIVSALASQGIKVFVTYLRQPPKPDAALPPAYYENRMRSADWLLALVRQNGGTASAWEADLMDPETPAQIFDRAEAAFGPVEILVNNAAFCEPDSFLGSGKVTHNQLGRDAFVAHSHDTHFAVNSRAAALLIVEFTRRHMARNGTWGRVVSITSAGRDGFPNEASYGASKAALESYTFTAASELASHGITANLIEPAGTDTGWIGPALADDIRRRSPFGRILQPEDVADAVIFFVSEQARYLTGQRLRFE